MSDRVSDLVEVLSLSLFVAEVGGVEDGSGAKAWERLPPKARDAWRLRTRSMVAALESAGFRVLPVEPDLGMRQACTFEQVEVDWPALLAAAPKATTGG